MAVISKRSSHPVSVKVPFRPPFMFISLLVSIIISGVLVVCDDGKTLHLKFKNKYSSLLDYFKWDVLEILKNATLKEMCIKHSGLQKSGVRGEAKVQKHIRDHINYFSPRHEDNYGLMTVRIDLLQCYVTFIDCNDNIIGKTTFYLAEGSETNLTLFKFHRIKNYFTLVGEIRNDMYLTWYSKENIHFDREEVEEDIPDQVNTKKELEVQQQISNTRKILENTTAEQKYEEKYLEEEESFEKTKNVQEGQDIQKNVQIYDNFFGIIKEHAGEDKMNKKNGNVQEKIQEDEVLENQKMEAIMERTEEPGYAENNQEMVKIPRESHRNGSIQKEEQKETVKTSGQKEENKRMKGTHSYISVCLKPTKT